MSQVPCPQCTYLNAVELASCEICDAPLRSTKKVTTKESSHLPSIKTSAVTRDLAHIDEAEVASMSKQELRELVIAQAEELRRLQARLRAQEDQVKQLSLHSLIQSGLNLVDEDAVAVPRDEAEHGLAPPRKGSHLLPRSPRTPPSSPVADSPLASYEQQREKEKESDKEKEKEKDKGQEKPVEGEKEAVVIQHYVPPPFQFTGEGCGILGVLPKEALLLILEFVTPKDMATLPCVSKEFQYLSSDEGLWKLLCYHWKQVTLAKRRAENLYLMPPAEAIENVNQLEKKDPSISWKATVSNEVTNYSRGEIQVINGVHLEMWSWSKQSCLLTVRGAGTSNWKLSGNMFQCLNKMGVYLKWDPNSHTVTIQGKLQPNWQCTQDSIKCNSNNFSDRHLWQLTRKTDEVNSGNAPFGITPSEVWSCRPASALAPGGTVKGIVPLPALAIAFSRLHDKIL